MVRWRPRLHTSIARPIRLLDHIQCSHTRLRSRGNRPTILRTTLHSLPYIRSGHQVPRSRLPHHHPLFLHSQLRFGMPLQAQRIARHIQLHRARLHRLSHTGTRRILLDMGKTRHRQVPRLPQSISRQYLTLPRQRLRGRVNNLALLTSGWLSSISTTSR